MAYNPFEWKDGSEGETPITAERLNALEQGVAEAGEEVSWGSIKEKPAEYPPEDHTHPASDIQGKLSNSQLPNIFISDIDGLQGDLESLSEAVYAPEPDESSYTLDPDLPQFDGEGMYVRTQGSLVELTVDIEFPEGHTFSAEEDTSLLIGTIDTTFMLDPGDQSVSFMGLVPVVGEDIAPRTVQLWNTGEIYIDLPKGEIALISGKIHWFKSSFW